MTEVDLLMKLERNRIYTIRDYEALFMVSIASAYETMLEEKLSHSLSTKH